MISFICKYCNKNFEFENIQQCGGHVSNCKENPNKEEKYKRSGESVSLFYKKKRDVLIEKYNTNPIICLNCNNPIDYEKKRTNKFCNHSCAATYTNLKKGCRSKKVKEKISFKARQNYLNSNPKCDLIYKECMICNGLYVHPSRKTCTNDCQSKHMSIIMTNRLKNSENRSNYGRHKKSYLEQSFEQWLIDNKVIYNFETEQQFYNLELKKYYYADFYFPKLKLIIELDGTQHLKTIESDKIRDEYLNRKHKLNVIRISHKEYRNKTKEELIKRLLHMPA